MSLSGYFMKPFLERLVGQKNHYPHLEKEMAALSSILAWKYYGQKSPVGYSPWGHKRVGHD